MSIEKPRKGQKSRKRTRRPQHSLPEEWNERAIWNEETGKVEVEAETKVNRSD